MRLFTPSLNARHQLVAIAFLLATTTNTKADLFWGADGTGGSGTWDTTTANWFDGTNAVTWPSTGSSAIFAGSAGTVTFGSSTLVAEKLDFRTPGYILSGYLLKSSASGLAINAPVDVTSTGIIEKGIGAQAGVFTKTGVGTLFVDYLDSFDEVHIESGELSSKVDGGSGNSTTYFFPANSGARFTLGGSVDSTFYIGALQGGDASAEIYPLDSNSGATGARILAFTSKAGSFGGILRDNGANTLAVTQGSGKLQELTGVNTYSGPTTITTGTISLAGGGSALNTAFTVNGRGILLLDNTAQAKSDRISDSAPLALTGTLAFRGNATAAVAEIAGPLTLHENAVIQVVADPAQPAELTFQSLAPGYDSSAFPLFIGSHLGAAPGAGVASVTFVTPPSLVGGGGADGTTTISVIPSAFGGENGAESLLTYGVHGVRPLAEGEYVHDTATAGPQTNVSVATKLTVTGTQSINALRLLDGSVLSGDGTLTVTSGDVLVLPGQANVGVAALDFGSSIGEIYTAGDLDLTGGIAGSKGWRKGGSGMLTLEGPGSFSGVVTITNGTILLKNGLALGSTATGSVVEGGADLVLDTGVTVGTESLALFGALHSLGGDTSWAGKISGIGTIGVDAGSLTITGATSASFIKVGSGLLVLSQATSLPNGIDVQKGTVRSLATGGVASNVTLSNGRLEVAPADTGADVAVTLAQYSLIYGNNAALVIDRGQNPSLTVTFGTFSPTLTRRTHGTMVIVPANGDLGTQQNFKTLTSSVFPQANGLLVPTIVMQEADSAMSASFLKYDATVGLLRADPTAPAGSTLQTAGPTAYFRADAGQTLTASATVFALQDQGQTIDLAGNTLTLGSNLTPSGLILNGGRITGGTLKITAEALIYTSLAGGAIESQITNPGLRGLTFFGPGVAKLTGDSSGIGIASTITVNSGTLQVEGRLGGHIVLGPDGTLAGAGQLSGSVSGGVASPGNGAAAAILTADSVWRRDNTNAVANSTTFDFELGHIGAPDFGQPTASGNDLLRLTNPTAAFNAPFDSSNIISLYFDTSALQLGDTFYGGLYTDLRADFTSSIADATFHFYLRDPNGTELFEGQSYSLAGADEFAISTAALSADFGSGQVDGQIMEIQVVPEPSSGGLLLAALGLAGFARPKRLLSLK